MYRGEVDKVDCMKRGEGDRGEEEEDKLEGW